MADLNLPLPKDRNIYLTKQVDQSSIAEISKSIIEILLEILIKLKRKTRRLKVFAFLRSHNEIEARKMCVQI